jgi:hypothetical protein
MAGPVQLRMQASLASSNSSCTTARARHSLFCKPMHNAQCTLSNSVCPLSCKCALPAITAVVVCNCLSRHPFSAPRVCEGAAPWPALPWCDPEPKWDKVGPKQQGFPPFSPSLSLFCRNHLVDFNICTACMQPAAMYCAHQPRMIVPCAAHRATCSS